MGTCLYDPPVPALQGKAACQPRKDGWRWQTSNSEYGKFYVSIHREFVKCQEVHKDCSKQCENLSNELQLAKCQLEKLKISCGRTLCNPDGNQVMSCSKLPTSPKLGKCDCPGKPGPPSSDMYVTEMMNQFNGAQRHDPQMLMDHIKDDHPHLVKRVRPKLPLSALKIGRNYQGGGENDNDDAGCCPGKLGCGLGSRPGSGSQTPRSARGPGGSGKRKTSPRPRSAPKKQKGAIYEAVSDLKHTAGGGVNLPPSQRYDFYRYFGYAGQGAKTSKGWHSVKIPWTETPR
ncbi:hypothetical protein KC19_12G171600 [Ceratodon purpureus]|uniref:Uncharacterized protein n=1 Tax=Ceratodon purpureus TaxID=3225 RepID=A0A8T0GE36_CERPU|nr:hypothetical protein KC19_12G171600 [Ceratodon purpureus]